VEEFAISSSRDLRSSSPVRGKSFSKDRSSQRA